MRLSTINLKNFASHKNTELSFGEDQSLVLIRGLNGSGKSYIMDSVPWAIYGKVERDGIIMRPRQLLRDDADTSQVLVSLEDDEKTIALRRNIGRKASNVQLFIDEDNESARTSKMTQIKIEKMLGFSFNSFMSASYISQGKVGAFTNGKSQDRVKILTDVLNLNIIDASVKSAKDTMSALQIDMSSREQNLKYLKDEINDLGSEEMIGELIQERKDILRLDERKLKRLKVLRDKINDRDDLKSDYSRLKELTKSKLSDKLGRLQGVKKEIELDSEKLKLTKRKIKSLASVVNKISEFEKLLKEYPYPTEELEEHLENMAKVTGNLSAVRDMIAKLKKLQKKGGICPTCGRNVKAGHGEISERLADLRKEALDWKKQHIDLLEQNKFLQKKIEKHEQVKDQKQNLEFKISGLDLLKNESVSLDARQTQRNFNRQKISSDIKSLNDDLKKARKEFIRKRKQFIDIDESSDVSDLNEEIDELNTSIGSGRKTLESLQSNLKRFRQIQDQIKDIEIKYSRSNKNLFYYKYWAEKFPQIKLGLIDSFIPQMESIANDILNSFSPIRIELSTVMEKQSGGLMDRFRIVVYEGKYVREWENWSGGEKKQVAIAICLSMNTTLWNMGFGLDFILMDEVFADIDIEKRPKVLDYLVKSGRNVFVISHTDINPSLFDRVITIKKSDGISKVDG